MVGSQHDQVARHAKAPGLAPARPVTKEKGKSLRRLFATLLAAGTLAGALALAAPASAAQPPTRGMAAPHTQVQAAQLSQRFTCPSPPNATGCFFATDFFGGPVFQAHPSGGTDQWRVIPADNRGSETNHLGNPMWLSAVSGAGAGHETCLANGERAANSNRWGRFYISTTGTCGSTPPPLPTGIVRTTASHVTPAVAPKITATTHLTNHPDNGNNGVWASEDFTRTVTIQRVGEADISNCPGSDTGKCWLWDATMTDSGSFTTIASALSPRAGTVLDLALQGKFSGGSPNVQFYSSWKTARASRVPATVDGPVSGRRTTTRWPELFFGSSAVFNSAANPGGPDLGHWAWRYRIAFGVNPQCPNDASQWVDGWNNSDGELAVDGDILAPNSAHC